MSTIEFQMRSSQEINSAARAGLIGGVSLSDYHASQRALSRSAEQAARRDQVLREVTRARRAERAGRRLAARNPAAQNTGLVSRWATWLPSVPRHRSSGAS